MGGGDKDRHTAKLTDKESNILWEDRETKKEEKKRKRKKEDFLTNNQPGIKGGDEDTQWTSTQSLSAISSSTSIGCSVRKL